MSAPEPPAGADPSLPAVDPDGTHDDSLETDGDAVEPHDDSLEPHDDAVETADEPGTERPRDDRWWPPALIAVGVYAGFVLVGMLVARHFAKTALLAPAQTASLAIGVVTALGLGVWFLWRRPGEWAAGVVLGALAGWTSLLLLVSLAGTPYGVMSLYGDCGRTVAAAERYTVTWGSADQFIAGLPSQYPPLYFWVWGRLSALLGKGAWQIMGTYQAIAVGGAVLVCGLLWRLVLPWWRAAFAAGLTTGAVYLGSGWDPCKGHESSALLTTVPILAAAWLVVDRVTRDGRLRPFAALGWGALTGLAFMTYQLGVLFGLPALVVVWAVLAVRRGHLLPAAAHVAIAAVTAFLVASPYLVPFGLAIVRNHAAPRAADPLMVVTSLTTSPGVPLQLGLVPAALLITGLLLLLLSWRRAPAPVLLTLLAGSLVIQALALLNVVRGGETFYSYRTLPWLLVVLSAAVAALADLAVLRRLAESATPARGQDVRRAGVVLVTLVVLAGVHGAWMLKHAPIIGLQQATGVAYTAQFGTHPTARAYLTPLPNCKHVKGLPADIATFSCYPATYVDRCITDLYGSSALPILLAYDERASMFRPNYLFLGPNGGATGPLDEWEQRYAFVKELAATADPTSFVRKARSGGRFGPIEGFVLVKQKDGTLRWTAQLYRAKGPVTFRPEQFPAADYATCSRGSVVVYLDRSATPVTH